MRMLPLTPSTTSLGQLCCTCGDCGQVSGLVRYCCQVVEMDDVTIESQGDITHAVAQVSEEDVFALTLETENVIPASSLLKLLAAAVELVSSTRAIRGAYTDARWQ